MQLITVTIDKPEAMRPRGLRRMGFREALGRVHQRPLRRREHFCPPAERPEERQVGRVFSASVYDSF